ncbi:MAG: hypothetical protein IJT07_00110, partial [Oscillospiraceae bacterium]|nr:hypothetical protein [Oscillospiraceae bacterium]
MFVLSYQQKARLRRCCKWIAIVLAIILILCLIRFFYLGRFIVYDSDGAHIQYEPARDNTSETMPPEQTDFQLVQERSESAANAAATHLRGIYLTVEQANDRAALRNAEAELTHISAMMLPAKTNTGTFLYPTALENTSYSEDSADAFLHLIDAAKAQNVYLIAALPAFADRTNAEAFHNDSLQIRGGALWLNADGSYCLDPRADHTREYLLVQFAELKALGFQEVWLTGFDFPDSRNIVLESDADTSLVNLATALQNEQGKDPIRISLETEDETCALQSAHHFFVLDEPLETYLE